jgi:hypothetical protein
MEELLKIPKNEPDVLAGLKGRVWVTKYGHLTTNYFGLVRGLPRLHVGPNRSHTH